ncbi:MAG: hypothetical protein EKK45_19230 [Curvibacter sp.]|nr:MAG: hypothetical protein EKK45_19230 [Curvibacter sp.]
MNANIVRGLVAAGVMVSAAAARAADGAVDVSGTTATITAQLAPIGLIGGACLGVYVAVKAFHWVRRALS